MNNILVFTNNINQKKKKMFVKLINKHLGGRGKCILSDYKDIFLQFGGKNFQFKVNGADYTNYKLVYFRRASEDFSFMANSLAIFFEYLRIKFFDTHFSQIGAKSDKLAQLARLYTNNIGIPETIYFSSLNMDKYSDKVIEILGLPLVAKSIDKQRGLGVFLINNIDDFSKLVIEKDRVINPYFFQKLINKKKEYRVLVLGGDVGVWEEKIASTKNEFRNNVSLGAKEIFLNVHNIPSYIKNIALYASSTLGLEISGVDIITEKNTDKTFILEVNKGPGLTYDERKSPEFNALASFFAKNLKK